MNACVYKAFTPLPVPSGGVSLLLQNTTSLAFLQVLLHMHVLAVHPLVLVAVCCSVNQVIVMMPTFEGNCHVSLLLHCCCSAIV